MSIFSWFGFGSKPSVKKSHEDSRPPGDSKTGTANPPSKKLLLQFTTRDTQNKVGHEFGAPLAIKYSNGTTSDMLPLPQVSKAVSDFVMDHGIRKILLMVHGFNTDETNFDQICTKYSQEVYEDGVGVIGFFWCGPFGVGKDSQRYFSDKIVAAASMYWLGWVAERFRSTFEEAFSPVILYATSAENAVHSAWSLYYLLIAIANHRPGYKPPELYILAHSMGTRLTVEALRMIVHDRSYTFTFIKNVAPHLAPLLAPPGEILSSGDDLSRSRDSSNSDLTISAAENPEETREGVKHLYNVLDQMIPPNFLKCLIIKEGDLDVDTFMRYMKYNLDRLEQKNFYQVAVYHRPDDQALAYSSAIHGLSVGSKAEVGYTRIGDATRIAQVRDQYISAKLTDWGIDAKQYQADPSDVMVGEHLNHSYWFDANFIASIKKIVTSGKK